MQNFDSSIMGSECASIAIKTTRIETSTIYKELQHSNKEI